MLFHLKMNQSALSCASTSVLMSYKAFNNLEQNFKKEQRAQLPAALSTPVITFAGSLVVAADIQPVPHVGQVAGWCWVPEIQW